MFFRMERRLIFFVRDMPRLLGIAGQTKYVCLCFSKTLSSQGLGTSHLKESVNLSLRARERIPSIFASQIWARILGRYSFASPKERKPIQGNSNCLETGIFSYLRLVLFLSPHASRLTLHEFPLYLLQPRPGYLHCCPACKVRIRRTSSIVCGFP